MIHSNTSIIKSPNRHYLLFLMWMSCLFSFELLIPEGESTLWSKSFQLLGLILLVISGCMGLKVRNAGHLVNLKLHLLAQLYSAQLTRCSVHIAANANTQISRLYSSHTSKQNPEKHKVTDWLSAHSTLFHLKKLKFSSISDEHLAVIAVAVQNESS